MSATASSQETAKRQQVDDDDKPLAKHLNPFHEAKVQLDEVTPSLPMKVHPFMSKKLHALDTYTKTAPAQSHKQMPIAV